MAPPPPPGAAYVRLRVTISGEGAHTTMTQRFVPAAGVLRNDDGAWLRLSPHTTAALRKAAHQVPPFRPEAAAASTHAPAPPSDGFPWPVVVALALAGVLAAIATRITLRRRAATQP
jgi:hypothetical protein